MSQIKQIEISTWDRVLRAWQNATELVRDYQAYSDEIVDDPHIARLFKEYAEHEALHASKLLEILHELQESGASSRS